MTEGPEQRQLAVQAHHGLIPMGMSGNGHQQRKMDPKTDLVAIESRRKTSTVAEPKHRGPDRNVTPQVTRVVTTGVPFLLPQFGPERYYVLNPGNCHPSRVLVVPGLPLLSLLLTVVRVILTAATTDCEAPASLPEQTKGHNTGTDKTDGKELPSGPSIGLIKNLPGRDPGAFTGLIQARVYVALGSPRAMGLLAGKGDFLPIRPDVRAPSKRVEAVFGIIVLPTTPNVTRAHHRPSPGVTHPAGPPSLESEGMKPRGHPVGGEPRISP